MFWRIKNFFLRLSFPGKVLVTGLATIALSWVPFLLYLVLVYGLLGIDDGNPIGLGLLMVFGSTTGVIVAALGVLLLLVAKLTGKS